MSRGVLVNYDSDFQKAKSLLDDDVEICKFGVKDFALRKHIDKLKRDYGYTIYRNTCSCDLSDRKHFSYEKDWACEFK